MRCCYCFFLYFWRKLFSFIVVCVVIVLCCDTVIFIRYQMFFLLWFGFRTQLVYFCRKPARAGDCRGNVHFSIVLSRQARFFFFALFV
ncbi:hypothetical protein TRSC58_07534 [Trypanosoma rangeli SC58]|uniref:Uncharacterized protein n=1 Tax=Trypanosoma rangeli SC58 TaxID=429131 RepID=A0A061ISM6_TRYRA|nr:hypothetical protein TRSC58_07534 [Trypanosoma rangeli SC58]